MKMSMCISVLLMATLAGCSSTKGSQDDYFGYRNVPNTAQEDEDSQQRHIQPPQNQQAATMQAIDSGDNAADYNATGSAWKNPLAEDTQTPTVYIENYYAGGRAVPYVPVIVPWWDVYSDYNYYPQAHYLVLHRSGWTWGWNWYYCPWYDYSPWYGYSYWHRYPRYFPPVWYPYHRRPYYPMPHQVIPRQARTFGSQRNGVTNPGTIKEMPSGGRTREVILPTQQPSGGTVGTPQVPSGRSRETTTPNATKPKSNGTDTQRSRDKVKQSSPKQESTPRNSGPERKRESGTKSSPPSKSAPPAKSAPEKKDGNSGSGRKREAYFSPMPHNNHVFAGNFGSRSSENGSSSHSGRRGR